MVELKKIGPYLNFIKGKAPSITFEEYKDGLKPYLSPEYLRGISKPLYVSPNGKLVKVEDGEIIVLWDGSNAGEIFTSKNGVLASTMTKISVDETEFDRKYFIYSMQYLEYILKAKTAGSGIPHVDKGILKNLAVYKPVISEQRKIASILTKVDDAIQAVKNTIEKAERLKKSLMQNLLTGKLKPDGSWRTEDEFYVDEKFGKIPIGWEVAPLNSKEVCKINPNYNFNKGEVFPFLPMEAVKDNFNGIINYEYKIIDSGGYTRFKEGDVLLAKITPCAENGKSTYIQKLDAKIGFASTEFIVLSPKEKINGEFLYYRIINSDIYNLMISLMEGTTGRQRIPTNIFKYRVLISYPINIEEQENIVSKIKYLNLLLGLKQQKIQKLERLKKALMQNLLTGKVRVKL